MCAVVASDSNADPDDVLRMREMSNLFALLSVPIRFRIIFLLIEKGPASVGQIVSALGASQPNISKHLAMLRYGGLVQGWGEGQSVIYRVTDSGRQQIRDAVKALLAELPTYPPPPAPDN